MSINFPPHLPPPTCSIPVHRRYERIKLVLIATVFGLLAGVTGMLIMVGYLGPQILGTDMWNVNYQSRAEKTSASIDDKVRIETEDKIGVVYKDAVNTNSGSVGYLPRSAKIGEGFFITSDGWMAMYYTDNNVDFKKWRVLLRDGGVFSVEKVITDRYANVIYLKVVDKNKTAQFKVANFVDDIALNDNLFAFQNNNWQNVVYAYKAYHTKNLPHLDSVPNVVYKMSTNAVAGQIVVNVSGKIVGFYIDQNNILPSVYLNRILPSILSKQKAVYYSLGAEGWYSQEQPIVFNGEQVSGFVVSRVATANSKLRVDDVMLEIKGQIVTPENLWYNISGDKTVKIKILRKGKTQEIESPVFQF